MLEVSQPRSPVLLLNGNAVQAKRAEFRPQIAGKLIALVDFGGARRDLVAREIVHGFAYSVRGFAEIEVEHPMRGGNHGCLRAIVRLISRTALCFGNKLVTGRSC